MLNGFPEFFHHRRKAAIKTFPSNRLSKCLVKVVWWSEKEGGVWGGRNRYINGATYT